MTLPQYAKVTIPHVANELIALIIIHSKEDPDYYWAIVEEQYQSHQDFYSINQLSTDDISSIEQQNLIKIYGKDTKGWWIDTNQILHLCSPREHLSKFDFTNQVTRSLQDIINNLQAEINFNDAAQTVRDARLRASRDARK